MRRDALPVAFLFFHVFAFISNNNYPVAYDIMAYPINNHDGVSPVETQNLASHEQGVRYIYSI